MWRANITGGVFYGGCLAVWQIDQVYPPSGRGENCTSADAAGLPIAPLLFTADEVATGEIRHAIRFILPNNLMRHLIYVHPATHSTSATTGPANAPPYGARMRLKASKDISGLKPAARVVARALQNYGMILADGGNITFTGASDAFTTSKWSAVGFATSDLTSLAWSDFEMVDGGQRFQYTGNCTHTPVTQ
jgi:serine/threonine-protein kinase